VHVRYGERKQLFLKRLTAAEFNGLFQEIRGFVLYYEVGVENPKLICCGGLAKLGIVTIRLTGARTSDGGGWLRRTSRGSTPPNTREIFAEFNVENIMIPVIITLFMLIF
jgi:hypothetical protein